MQASALVDALKRMLKGQGLTYADVAAGLNLSEASVKRMFSRRDFTLQRLEDVCRLAGIDFADLARAVSEHNAGISQLTVEQEEEIVSDPKLMLVALCAVNNWTLEQIVATYEMSQAECIRCLVRLDRRRIIHRAFARATASGRSSAARSRGGPMVRSSATSVRASRPSTCPASSTVRANCSSS